MAEEIVDTPVAPVAAPEVQSAPDAQSGPDPKKALYQQMVADKLYSKTFDDFSKQFSTHDKVVKLHDFLTQKGKYDKGTDAFNKQFFPDVNPAPAPDTKKKTTDQSAPSAPVLPNGSATSTPPFDPSQQVDISNPVQPIPAPPDTPLQDVQAVSARLTQEHQAQLQKQQDQTAANLIGSVADVKNLSNPTLSTNPALRLPDNVVTKTQDANDMLKQATGVYQSAHPDASLSLSNPTDQAKLTTYKPSSAWDDTKYGIDYLQSKFHQGINDVVKGGLHLGKMVSDISDVNPQGKVTAEKEYNDLSAKMDEDANSGLDKNATTNSKILGVAGDLLHIAPAILTSESTGGASFYLQGIGGAAKQVEDAKKAGVKFDNHSDELFIQGSGIINYLLGKSVSGTVLSKMGSGFTNDVVGTISAEATKDLANMGANATAADVAHVYSGVAVKLAQRVQQYGMGILDAYPKVTMDFAGANLLGSGVKAGVNAMNGDRKPLGDVKGEDIVNDIISPVYNGDTPANGDLGQFAKNLITSPAAGLSVLHGVATAGMLFDKSPMKNTVIESLQKDNSVASVNDIKNKITQIGLNKGWSADEVNNTHTAVDALADIAGKLPKNMQGDEFKHGVDLIAGRRQLQAVLDEVQQRKKDLDPSLQGQVGPFEDLLNAKIDQANDKLSSLVTKKPFTYFENEGQYFKKQEGGEPVPITKARYDLEGIENDHKPVAEQSKLIPEGLADKKGNPIPPKEDESTSKNVPAKEKVSPLPAESKPASEKTPTKDVVEVGKPAKTAAHPGVEITNDVPGIETPISKKIADIEVKRKADLDEVSHVINQTDKETLENNINKRWDNEIKKLKDNAKPEGPEAVTAIPKEDGKDETKAETQKTNDGRQEEGLLNPEKGKPDVGQSASGIAKIRIPQPEFEDIRTATKNNHGNDTPENLAKETNTKTWYHGSNKDLTNEHVSSAAFTRPDSLLGLGFYMTDNPEIAEKYANLRRNKSGSTVNEFKVKTSKVLDAEKPIDSDVADTYKRVFQTLFTDKDDADRFFDDVKKHNPNANLMDYHKAIYEYIADEHIPTNDVTENFQELEQSLKDDLGFDGISHIGGKILGGKNHNVMILFDPSGEYSDNRKPFIKKGKYEPKYQEEGQPSDFDKERQSIEKETDPVKIAAKYHTEVQNEPDYIEKGIIDYIGNGKINLKDYERYGDKNNVDKAKKLRWLDETNSDKTDLAQHAEILSHELGVQVTPQDFIETIDRYRGRSNFEEANKTETQKLLEDKYKDLTGNNITPKRAETAYNKQRDLKTELTPEEIELANKGLSDLGITYDDVKAYEEFEKSSGTNNGRSAEGDEQSVPGQSDDKNGSQEKSTGDKGSQKERKSSLDEEEAARLEALRKKFAKNRAFSFGGAIGDALNKLFDKEHYEYMGLVFKEAAGDFKAFAKELIDMFGDKIKQHLPEIFKEFGGKDADIPNEYKDDVENIKKAYNKSKSFVESLKKTPIEDELLNEFSDLDPRYLTPAEMVEYNNLTDGKNLKELSRDAIAKFIDDVHDRQDEASAERQKEWYKQLQDDPEFDGENVKKVIKDVDAITGDETDLDSKKENETAKSVLNKLLRFNRSELRKVVAPTGFEDAKKALLALDESKLSSRELRDANRAIEAMVNDGNYAGSGKWIALHDSVKRAADILASQKGIGFKTGETSKFAGEFRSLPQNIEIITKDSKLASVVQERSGIFDISAGNAKVNDALNGVTKEFTKMIDGMPRGTQSVENRYKRGILAAFTQRAETNSPEDHFNRYKNYVASTARRLLRSSIESEKKEGSLVQDLYDKYVKSATSSDDVVNALTKENTNNAKIVKFFIDKHQGIYPQLRQSTLLYSGKELPLIQNYTSTQMKRLRGADEKQVSASSIIDPVSMDAEDNSTDTGQARTTIKRKRSMGPDRVMNFNFDGLQLNRLRESHYDVQTLPYRYLFDAIRTQPDFKEALGNRQANVNVVSSGVEQMVKAQRGFNSTGPVAKMILDITNMIGRAGTRIALKGIDQFPKHYVARSVDTMGNLGKDIDLYFKSIARVGKNNPIFNQSSIGMRGLQKGGTDIENNIKKFQKYDFVKFGDWMNAIHKVFDKTDNFVGASLTLSDELIAQHSWGAYYMQDMRKRGIDVDSIDWATEYQHINKEAAAYAEQMTGKNQIPNDPTQRAMFDQRGDVKTPKDVLAEVVKNLAAPFTGYSRNLQIRIENDIRKMYGGDRKRAMQSLASTIAETGSFQVMRILLKIAYGAAAAAVLGYFGFDEPDNDYTKDWKQLPSQTINDMLLAGTGSAADAIILKGINNGYEMATGNQSEWLPKSYDPGKYGETDFGAAGMYGIIPQKIENSFESYHYAFGHIDDWANEHGKKVEYESFLTDRQKWLMRGVFLLDIMGTTGFGAEASTQRLNSEIFNQVKKQVRPVNTFMEKVHNKKSPSQRTGNVILKEQ